MLLDGQDLTTCTLDSVRRHIAVVPQDAVLFNDTVDYNIRQGRAPERHFVSILCADAIPIADLQPALLPLPRYARPEATAAEVEEAARMAQIHAAIAHFPAGYATLVGERGLRLSGGEKQRVAFARAVLRRPRLLVLDEATSALDSITERSMQEALAGLRATQGCTTLIIAHRLSTIMDCDSILVLERGEVKEAGSFAELLQRGGLFAEMWRHQQESGAGVLADGEDGEGLQGHVGEEQDGRSARDVRSAAARVRPTESRGELDSEGE